jgi:peptidoglycan/xylan/chitin deacetylase (PgdA/CDA1 family)
VKLASVNVDLDEIPNYFAIHGLEASGQGLHAVYDKALGRMLEWAAAMKMPLTLFTIADDMGRQENRAIIANAARRGHEIASHTRDHRYDLVRLDRAAMTEQVEGAAAILAEVTGERPRGFRAPGYTFTGELATVLRDVGHGYDSSVFGCPAYYCAKAAALTVYGILGRTSRSILGEPEVLLAPRRPYRLGEPYWREGDGLPELPIQVTPGIRMPIIGTNVTLWGERFARKAAAACANDVLFNFELHGIDFLDAEDGLEALRPHQPDVRVPVAKKLDALSALVEELRGQGRAFVRLDEAAHRLFP